MTEPNTGAAKGPTETEYQDCPPPFASPSHPPTPTGPPVPPPRIRRYRVERVLGEGAFGRVYLARDDELGRLVAVKAPYRERVARPQDLEAYLAEARTLAGLDHPHIVPVYDAGRTDDGLCFVVSKFIEGCDLKQKLNGGRLPHTEAAELAAAIAEALHYAHSRGVVHRDVKPANILIDAAGKPYLADFGVALKEQDFGKGIGFAGTPAYMSPEQARGEGHRVDGRSDVFSLGVVFYEMLSGQRPFGAEAMTELLEQIIAVEAKPPRRVDAGIPRALERICLKALAKRASERYPTARDFAEDLRHFLGEKTTNAPPASPITASRDRPHLKVIPKGLRSFDAGDADFFLELLPGPRDRDGLPDGVRFWKRRIEETDPGATFRVGVVYGSSGCGKSSLVKAGLLPRLADSVIAVSIEATGADTEARLLKGLRLRCPGLAPGAGLAEAVAAVRRGGGAPAGSKVLIVLDQFEQWLHARRAAESAELVEALRQCDGARVQCLVLVRDDFWMPLTRFMQLLEVRLVEGENCAAVDLFDRMHARNVLAAFGRAFGRLHDAPSKEQEAFLNQTVAGLAQDDRVISVRLALFAEMVKGRPWTTATLKAVGGAEGVGAAFLEDSFSSTAASPRNRLHQQAARSILKALLPEQGADIKGHMHSYEELLQASGYARRPKDFDDLLRVLDGELRLITPTDPEGVDPEAAPAPANPGGKYYQLAHDYLVHSLRDWLTRKQRETRRGRAEIRLAFWASLWNAKPENRNLPSLAAWMNMRLLTKKVHWTPPQRKMMRRAARRHAVKGAVLAVFLAAGVAAGLAVWNRANADHAAGLVDQLRDADIDKAPDIIAAMGPYRRWTDPMLRDAYAEAERNQDSRRQLRAGLALLPVDPGKVDYLYGRLLDAQPQEVGVLVKQMSGHKEELIDRLWVVFGRLEKGREDRRLRAAAALAAYDPDGPRWVHAADAVVDQLVEVNPVFLAAWIEALRPVREKLLRPLAAVFRDRKEERSAERQLATSVLADYAADRPELLADLLMDADDKQFAVLFPKLEANLGPAAAALFVETVKRPLAGEKADEDKEALAKRQANAAVALLRLGRPDEVWPLFRHSSDPRARSYLIHRIGPLGAGAGGLIHRLDDEPDVTIRRALLLSLGEFSEKGLSSDARKELLPKVKETYRAASDPGLHGSAEWLLRTWEQDAWLRQVNEEWTKDGGQREKRLDGVKEILAKDEEKAPQWYVNGQGQTMVVIPGPVEFLMGSPPAEADRSDDETRHKKRIDRPFALAAKAVTVEQYRRFDAHYELPSAYTRMADLPVVGIDWYRAAKYCNWLSEEEGVPEEQRCYEIQGSEIKLKANYPSLGGYRLPTEAEMEYATRAGATTARYFGESEDLLSKYARYTKNSRVKTWPVGSLKPNDYGLFDMQGNVWTWCQESYKGYPQEEEDGDDKEGDLAIVSTRSRVLRGGSFNFQASYVRSAARLNLVPTYRAVYDVGFRLARTFH